MSPKPTYIPVPSDSTAGVLEDAWHASGNAGPDWYIVDDFFRKQGNIKRINDADENGRVFWLTAGETCKTWNGVERVLEWLVKNDVKRSDGIAVVGGGTVLDTGLFAASIYQREKKKPTGAHPPCVRTRGAELQLGSLSPSPAVWARGQGSGVACGALR